MTKIQTMLPALFVVFLIFYTLPFFGRDTGTFMVILLLITPAACLIVSIWQGYRQGFQMVYPLMVGLLFAPTLYIYYNYTAWVYIVIYGVIALTGMGLGSLFRRQTTP